MKKVTFLILFAALFVSAVNAQAPWQFNYQAVLRDDAGQVLASEEVSVEISILKDSPEGEEVFTETHQTATNEFGLVNLQVGSLSSLEDIDWKEAAYFVRVSVNGSQMGTSPLLSVPYAMHAATSADAFSGDYEDLENLPDLDAFIGIEDAQQGDMLFYSGENWQVLNPGEEGQVLMVVEGMPQWAEVPENGDEPGTVSDIDGNVYPTVVIGTQEWMAENLRTTRYANGDDIPTGLGDNDWVNTTDGAYAVFPHENVDGVNSEEQMIEYYGKLYNWYAVDDSRGLCPAGWKVPDYNDWDVLEGFLTGEGHDGQQGNVLKDCRQVDSPLGDECQTSEHPRWNEDTWNDNYGTDLYGFSGLPSGYRGNNGFYFASGMLALYWTSSESGDNTGWHRHLSVNGSILNIDNIHQKITGFSIRCIKE